MLCKNELYDTSGGKEMYVLVLILVDWKLVNFGRWKLWLKLLKSKSACFESHVSRSCNFVMFQDWITNQKSWILYPFIANLWNYNKKKNILCFIKGQNSLCAKSSIVTLPPYTFLFNLRKKLDQLSKLISSSSPQMANSCLLVEVGKTNKPECWMFSHFHICVQP